MKILIWAMARALGDGVIYTGYPREIKKIYPDAEIHIFSTKMYAAAFKNNPNVDKFYFFNTYNKPFNKITRTKIFLNPVFHLKNLLKARHEKYDILIDVDSSYKWSNRFMIRFIMGGVLLHQSCMELLLENLEKILNRSMIKSFCIKHTPTFSAHSKALHIL